MKSSRYLAVAAVALATAACSGTPVAPGTSATSASTASGSIGASATAASSAVGSTGSAAASTGSAAGTHSSSSSSTSAGPTSAASTSGTSATVSTTGSASTASAATNTSTSGSPTTATSSSGTNGSTSNGSTGGSTSTSSGSTGGSSSGDLGSCNPSPGYTGNAEGIGAYCTATSNTCNSNLTCAAAFSSSYDFCVQVTCDATTDCGAGACCANYGLYSACVPTGCGVCTAPATSTSSSGSSSGSTGTSGSGSSGSSGSGSSSGSTGGAITGLTANTWNWVDFPTALCRDGSATGLGINPSPSSSDKVMIFLMGGGACFNFDTCVENPSSFGSSDLSSVTAASGILDRSDPNNPVADWNWVFVPYCTGDIHGGGITGVSVSGVSGTQDFVGYLNMQAYLARLAPTYASASQVLLTGVSAGGFGAAVNYTQVARAFPSVNVNMIDDSGPFMEPAALPVCMQQQVRTLWGLDSTVLADCGTNCDATGNYFLPYAQWVIGSYPDAQFGLIEDTDDETITQFFGFGDNDCAATSGIPPAVSATVFDAGLMDIRNQLASDTNFGTFYFAGTDHTSLGGSTFDTRAAPLPDGGTMVLSTWTTDLVGGTPPSVGP